MPMKIIVVLCTHNGAAFIEEQLLSLNRQSIAPSFVELHDWGSTDETAALLKAWLNDSNNPLNGSLTLHDSVPGPAQSFFKASEQALSNHASATHFMFCDQDDVWSEFRIKRYVSVIDREAAPIDLLFSDARVVAESGDLLQRSFYNDIRSPFRFPVGLESPDVAIVNPVLGFTMCVSRRLMELLVLHQNGPWQMHDWAAVILCRVYGFESRFIREALADYRQHGSNVRGAPSLGAIRARVARLQERGVQLEALSKWEQSLDAVNNVDGFRIPNGRAAAIRSTLRSTNLKWWFRLFLSSILFFGRRQVAGGG